MLFLKKQASFLIDVGTALRFNSNPRSGRRRATQTPYIDRGRLRRYLSPRRIRRPTPQPRTHIELCRAAAIVLGFIYAFGARYRMYPDTVSYLDMGDAYLRGDFAHALNAYWGALYAWLLGAAVAVFDPNPYGEAIIVHVVNYGIFLGSLIAFEFCMRNLVKLQQELQRETGGTPDVSGLVAWGYALYTWSALELVTVSIPTPDMCVAAAVMFAVGIIAKIRAGRTSLGLFAALGLILGVGYLAKSAMFPLGIVFLATAWIAYGRRGGLLGRILISTCGFAAVAALMIVPLSISKGRPTFGDSGRLNYAWHVNRMTQFAHWHPGDDAHGTPEHATRIISTDPKIYEFATPVSGTYPPWYDPSFWYEGIQPKFDLRQQCVATAKIVRDFSVVLFREQSFFVAAGFGLFLFALIPANAASKNRWTVAWTCLCSQWHLFLPAIAAFGMYSLVHIEVRYIGPFLFMILIGVACASQILMRGDDAWRRYALSLALVMWGLLAVGGVRESAHTADDSEHCRVAEGLWRLGVQRGAPIGHLGNSFKAYWARYGRFQIVAEIRPEDLDHFANGDAQTKKAVIDAFRSCGVRAIVARRFATQDVRWVPIPKTNYSAYLFDSKK